jgi:hypothetical protein
MRYVTIIIFMVVVLGSLLFLKEVPVYGASFSLQVWDTTEKTLLLQVPIEKGEEFSICYTHSIAKTLVEEFFVVEDEGQILLTRATFSSGGWGLPDVVSGGEAIFSVIPNGMFVLDKINRKFTVLENIRVAFLNPFLLRVGNRSFALEEYAKGRLVNICVTSTK